METSLLETNYISRDLSWVKFNERVLDQTLNESRSLMERLKFLAITASNLDEFFQIRIGSLYNYLDYGRERIDYSGLREYQFKKILLDQIHEFYKQQQQIFRNNLLPLFDSYHLQIIENQEQLSATELEMVYTFFKKTIFPMLTPMTYDSYHSFPIVMNKLLTFGVVSINTNLVGEQKRLTFVQIPQNLPRYFEIVRDGKILLIPIQEIVRWYIFKLFRNIEIQSVTLFRIIRNGDFMVEETDDMDDAFVDEVKRKIKTRRTARVVRVEIEQEHSAWLLNLLKDRYVIDDDNIFYNSTVIDFTSLWHIVNHPSYKSYQSKIPAPVTALAMVDNEEEYIFDLLQKQDVMLHHPFNSFNVVVDMIEKAADDPNVMALKITIYRLAKNSRITNALLRAAENGKHVSVLFEVKARFDEENNIKEGQRLQKAGCFVVYGVSRYKTHTKLLLIVRKNADESITRYVHLSSGNYNEDTAKLYTDISLLTTNEAIAQDVSEFFNVITGHSEPEHYQSLITAPGNMRSSLIQLIQQEAEHAKAGKPSGIVIKINSLQDKESIDALYVASQAGVPIHLVVRGMCCLRPGIKGLSDNITVRSLIGDFLEHTRIYYFHNAGQPKVYGGSADMMVRSFDRRIESLFLISDPLSLKMAIHILKSNLLDNVNAYELLPNDNYIKVEVNADAPVNVHQLFFTTTKQEVESVRLF